ncbi:protein of unknown function [Rhodovastum atsumiense]|nr:protein of unknown function [Rhodovastum atsumiense]
MVSTAARTAATRTTTTRTAAARTTTARTTAARTAATRTTTTRTTAWGKSCRCCHLSLRFCETGHFQSLRKRILAVNVFVNSCTWSWMGGIRRFSLEYRLHEYAFIILKF